jgi:hypothetical protein
MTKRILLAIALCFSSVLAIAQGQGPQQATIGTLNACATIAVDPRQTASVDILVTGTWSGTLTPKVGVNGNTPTGTAVYPQGSTTSQNTITANGDFTAVQIAGHDLFEVCFTSYSSGSAVITLTPSVAVAANTLGGGGGGGGSGTVTSVTFTGDGIVDSNTPSSAVTSSGTVTATANTQTPNYVLAGPATGSTHLAPTFRGLVTTDLPTSIPFANLAALSANTVLGALTATTPSGLALPSCSGATNALIWTSGTGFGCNTITSGSGTVNSGTQYQMGYYATSTTAISGSSNIVTDSSGDLIVAGGVTTGGSTAVGGTAKPFWGGTESTNTFTPTSGVDGVQLNSTSHCALFSFNGSTGECPALLNGSFTAGHALKVNAQLGSGSAYDLADAGYSATAIPLTDLATQAANTITGNATSGSAAPTALAIGSCSGATNALIWTTNSGFGCNTLTAGSGTVTSVAQTVPTGFAIGGSPITTSGTLAITTTGLTTNHLQKAVSGGIGDSTVVDTGSIVTTNESIESGASFLPANSGVALGAVATPFTNLFLYGGGTYGTDSFEITGTSTANRTVTLPDNSGPVGELNLAQTWSAVQTISASNGLVLSAMTGTACLEEVSGVVTSTGSACGSGGSGTVTSVATGGIATGGPITSTGTVTVAGSGNTTTATTASSSVAGAAAGVNILADGSGNVTPATQVTNATQCNQHYHPIAGSGDQISSATSFATTASVGTTCLAIGTKIDITAHGVYTTTSTTSPKIAFQVNAGSTTGICPATTTATTLPVNITNGYWELECIIQINTTGSSGTAVAWGKYCFLESGQTLATGQVACYNFGNASTGTVTYNTSTSETVSVQQTGTSVSGQTYNITALDIVATD